MDEFDSLIKKAMNGEVSVDYIERTLKDRGHSVNGLADMLGNNIETYASEIKNVVVKEVVVKSN